MRIGERAGLDDKTLLPFVAAIGALLGASFCYMEVGLDAGKLLVCAIAGFIAGWFAARLFFNLFQVAVASFMIILIWLLVHATLWAWQH